MWITFNVFPVDRTQNKKKKRETTWEKKPLDERSDRSFSPLQFVFLMSSFESYSTEKGWKDFWKIFMHHPNFQLVNSTFWRLWVIFHGK